MKREDAMNWVNALRSGKYKQGHYFLKNNDRYCCLGVLNELYPELRLSGGSSMELFNYQKIGLNGPNGELPGSSLRLSDLNDSKIGYFNFDEIADIIQIYYVEGI